MGLCQKAMPGDRPYRYPPARSLTSYKRALTLLYNRLFLWPEVSYKLTNTGKGWCVIDDDGNPERRCFKPDAQKGGALWPTHQSKHPHVVPWKNSG